MISIYKLHIIKNISQKDLELAKQIRWKTWKVSYAHIFTQKETDDYFYEVTKEKRTWESDDYHYKELIFVLKEQKHVGFTFISYGDGIAELNSLYVLPEYQNDNIGSKLWQKALDNCLKLNCNSMKIWVMEKSNSLKFYQNRDCIIIEEGDYWIGEHCEKAICLVRTIDN